MQPLINQINVSELENGFYLINISDQNQSSTEP
jgi:hypothetical protein